MTANSEIILSSNTHSENVGTEIVTGEKFKGDGYYSRSDGIHTVQYNYSNFTGTISIQATLEVNPQEADWFTVHTYTASQETNTKISNFTGNYVWVRAKITYTSGTINSVLLNH